MTAPLTTADYTRARRLLMRRDPVLATAIKRIGPCGLASRQHADHLSALVGAIVSQQLSTKAAATISCGRVSLRSRFFFGASAVRCTVRVLAAMAICLARVAGPDP